MTTRRDVEVAEAEARAHLRRATRAPDYDTYVCGDCPDENGYADPSETVTHIWTDGDERTPLCHFHADERVHDAIPYGSNCSECGTEHSALWPTGEPLFDREETIA